MITRVGRKIPSDNELRTMTKAELDRLADSLTDDADLEELSTAMLRVNGCLGHKAAAWSEARDTFRNRRIRARQSTFSEVGECDWIEAQMPDEAICRLIKRAAKAACTQRQAEVWALTDLGASQTAIAQALGISQSAVHSSLVRARKAILAYIETDSLEYRVWLLSCRRPSYYPPHHGPTLPTWLDPVRQRLELEPAVTTHVQADVPGILEVWRNGEIAYVARNGHQTPERYSIGRFRPRSAPQRKGYVDI